MVFPLGDLQRTRIVPVVTYAMIAINVAVFLVELRQGDDFTLALAATPYEITHNEDLGEAVEIPVRVQVRDPFGDVHWEERDAGAPTRSVPDSGAHDAAHLDVPARELAALAGEHAVSVDRG